MTPEPLRRLADRLPDLPRWVETRGALLSGRCEVLPADPPGFDFVVRATALPLAGMVGRPPLPFIRQSVSRAGVAPDLLAPAETAGHAAEALPGWRREPAFLFLLTRPCADLRELAARRDVRLLGPAESRLLAHLPGPLRAELREVLGAPRDLAAAFDSGQAVSFCHAPSQTEGLWDVSIDTLAGHRRRGLAAACVAFLIERMRARGKAPVWGALRSNHASLKLARRLGFEMVDELVVFTRS